MSFGLIPFGLSLGMTPIAAAIPNTQDLLDINNSNTVQTARYINPNTQDFELSSDGLYAGMNEIDQQVQLAISTTFNSSSVLNFGQNFKSISVITPYIRKQIIALLNQCLNYQIQNNLIAISNASVQVNQFGQVLLNFSFTNLLANTQTQVQYLIPGAS